MWYRFFVLIRTIGRFNFGIEWHELWIDASNCTRSPQGGHYLIHRLQPRVTEKRAPLHPRARLAWLQLRI